MLEEPLNDHPAIAQVVAIGQPDPYAGEIPVVYLTVESGQNVSTEQLMDYCRKNISERAAVPKRIEIIDEIPLTAVAKFYRPALRIRATDFALSSSLIGAGIQALINTKCDQQHGLVATITLANSKQRAQAETLLQGYPLIIEFA